MPIRTVESRSLPAPAITLVCGVLDSRSITISPPPDLAWPFSLCSLAAVVGMHIHSCDEIMYVIEGELSLAVAHEVGRVKLSKSIALQPCSTEHTTSCTYASRALAEWHQRE